ncbi:MAG TPA: glycosyltransferase family 87 protein [Anaerolineales bacterium]|nr:glycosyltransferase family 87 protein [Anaerolineales bacterium]
MFNSLGIILTAIVLGSVFCLKALQNYAHQDYTNSNFFFFWLSGRMMWTGQNPYDSTQWLAGHDAFGATWRPNQIFPYPLPLAFFMVPLGMLSLGQAYLLWQIVSQIGLALIVYWLIHHWQGQAERILFLPLMVVLLFFGPVYLTLQIGSVGPLALAAIALAIVLFEHDQPVWAGMLLSLTLLKPPQGLTLLILAGIWFLSRRDWKAIAGVTLGGIILLIAGMIRDPLWVIKMRGASAIVLDRTMGVDSNVYSFAYLACSQNVPCMWIAGTLGAIVILAAGGYYLWHNHARLNAWEAFNIIIPLGFVSTIYLWSYDQLPYVIPIVWIAGTLVERTKSYIQIFVFLVVLDVLSIYSLLVQANTHKDLLSIVNTVLVLGGCLLLGRGNQQGAAFSSTSHGRTPQ